MRELLSPLPVAAREAARRDALATSLLADCFHPDGVPSTESHARTAVVDLRTVCSVRDHRGQPSLVSLPRRLPTDGADRLAIVATGPDGPCLVLLAASDVGSHGSILPVPPACLAPAPEVPLRCHGLRDLLSAGTLATLTAGEYLRQVTTWLAGRRSYGQATISQPVLRRRLAEAIIAHRTAVATLDVVASGTVMDDIADLCVAAVRTAAECVRRCEDVHAGAGVFDPAPALGRRLDAQAKLSAHAAAGSHAGPPGPVSRRRADLAWRLRQALAGERSVPGLRNAELVTDDARRLVALLERLAPLTESTLLDDLVVAEALAEALPPGLAARVMTHRQVVRAYACGPWASASAAARRSDLLDGTALAAVAVTEPSAGSDLNALSTGLTRDGAGMRLDGVKTYVAGGADASHIVVAARDGHRLALVLVDADQPGLTRRTLSAPAWRGVGFAELEFRGYHVTDEDMMPGVGVETLMAGLFRERLILAAQQSAYARRWLGDVGAAARAELSWRLIGAQTLVEQALDNAEADVPTMIDSSIAKLLCCSVAAEVAVARTAALLPTAEHPEDLLDDEASARACTFAGGTPDINLAVAEGLVLSLLPGQERHPA
ncbi:acyl-CoA dehydrogenase family protein [Micromonospora sp. NPDC051925]|uniref:acyl-CoA dehydrogenase family protein n=1 Tax=Micromonospora sp. NPDC051925 TaxID=3364288 RepID=UPI0037C9C678